MQINAEMTVNGVAYQWVGHTADGLNVVNFWQQQFGGSWLNLGTTEEFSTRGSLQSMMQRMYDAWASASKANGFTVNHGRTL